ncbi:MAG TPA: FAD-linked oxidase C-terminal domain-containing protein, partial [Actinomycetota bacterium]|nr:FAD-linked oxidase C-terminal domain-containing protein [Actinomycetota bacterium]
LGARPWQPGSGGLGVKLAAVPSGLPGALETVWATAAAHGLAARAAAHAATGILWAGLDRAEPAFVNEARERLAGRATLVVAEAPLEAKRVVDAWGPAGDALPLMRRVKERFDPAGLLSPGRFAGGI